MIFARRRLLARLGAVEPRLVRLCAPAGYGKTDFAGLWARRFERHAVCDCAAVTGTVDFAGRLMSALARESHAGGEAIGQVRLFLHATEADEGAWNRALLDCWKLRQERALLILENADGIASHPGVLALLGDLLAARPAERTLLVSSRRPLPLDVARYLAPHQVLTLSRHELTLDNDEAASVFAGTDLGEPTVERILELAAGWPIAVVLLARIAHYEADLDRLLDRLTAIAPDMHEYLLNEVLSALTPEMTATMLAAAAIPHATLEDLSVATEIAHAAPIIEGLLRLPGFISYEYGTYRMHPLLHSALRARHGEDFPEYVVRAAKGNERLGDFLRAAELYNVAGDRVAAGAALDRLSPALLGQPSSRLIDALAQIPISVIASRPNLWMAILPHRRQSVESERLYDESIALLREVTPGASPALHRRLSVRRAMLACERDRFGEARATLDALVSIGSDETPEERRLALMTAAVVAAKQGRFFDADACVEEANAVHDARHLRFEEERTQIAMEKAFALGDWENLLRIGEERLTVALRAGPNERIVEAARAVTRAAWYVNEDDRMAAAQQIVKDCGLAAAAAIEPPAFADIQTAMTMTDAERVSALLDRAIERIDVGESDGLRIVVRVFAALLMPSQRRRLLEARALARPIESPPLQTSIELLIDAPDTRDYGIFKSLAARIAHSPLRARQDRVFVDVIAGQVLRGSQILHVSDRGLELLAALAICEPGTSSEALAGALSPTLDRKAGVNALKMCVSRTRAQLGDRESIQNTRNGYVLGEHVDSDVHEVARLLQATRGAGTLGESLRQRISRLLSRWGDSPPAHAGEWAWFAPHALRFLELRRELADALARDAARREPTGLREAVST